MAPGASIKNSAFMLYAQTPMGSPSRPIHNRALDDAINSRMLALLPKMKAPSARHDNARERCES